MAEQTLYHLPKSKRDPTRYLWAMLALFVGIAVTSCWLCTELTAWSLGFDPALGGSHGLYSPFDIFAWLFRFDRPDNGAAVVAVLERARVLLGVGALMSLLVPVVLSYRRTRRRHDERNDLHGSAHWADADEVAATGLLPSEKNKGGVLFGAWGNPSDEEGRVRYLRHKGPEHMLVFAPTRSGKGVGIVIPTLLSWDESALMNDIKGELWQLTSGFRSKVLGQRCIRFAPAERGSARFNPLDAIRIDDNFIKDVQNIATMIVDPDGKGLSDHWAKTGFDLLVGTILFAILDTRIRDKTLCGVAALLSNGGELAELALDRVRQSQEAENGQPIEGAQAVMQIIRDTAMDKLRAGNFDCDAHRHGWNVAAQASQAMLNKAANEFSGVMSTTLSFLTLYRDPIIAENTASSDFTIEDLMGGPRTSGKPGEKVSLYIVSPPSDKDRIKPLTRLMLNMVIRRLTEGMTFNPDGSGQSLYWHRLLLLIDEFPSLGKLDVFQEALAFIAGYGLTAILIAQDLSQLMAAYTEHESIVSNCHIRIAYAPNKIETAELLSKMAGQSTVTYEQLQYSGNRLSAMLQNVNTNEQIVERPLLTADECMRLPANDEIVFVAGHAPIYAQKIKYYADDLLLPRMQMGPAGNTGRRATGTIMQAAA